MTDLISFTKERLQGIFSGQLAPSEEEVKEFAKIALRYASFSRNVAPPGWCVWYDLIEDKFRAGRQWQVNEIIPQKSQQDAIREAWKIFESGEW